MCMYLGLLREERSDPHNSVWAKSIWWRWRASEKTGRCALRDSALLLLLLLLLLVGVRKGFCSESSQAVLTHASGLGGLVASWNDRKWTVGSMQQREEDGHLDWIFVFGGQLSFIPFIHSFIRVVRSSSYDRSVVSSKASSPHSAMWCFLFQFTISSRFLKVIQ